MYSKCTAVRVHLLYTAEDQSEVAAELRALGGEKSSIEVKAAAGGWERADASPRIQVTDSLPGCRRA